MRNFVLGFLLLGLAIATDALQQHPRQRYRRTTGNDVTQEEPHPYTISFFLFPHGSVNELLNKKTEKKSNIEHKNTKTTLPTAKANTTGDAQPLDDDDLGANVPYQQGSIKHPKHEMYPHCHQCNKNSTYHECIQKKTLTTCSKGLANICFTRSEKRDKIVHYEMGCASHNECQRARAKPCKLQEKRCFTCCQWSGCNSQSHHHKHFPFAAGREDETELSFRASAVSPTGTWILVVTSLLGALVY